MIQNQDIDMLSNEIRSRHQSTVDPMPDMDPFILFLGNDCARAAKVPDIKDIAAKAHKLFTADNVELSYFSQVNSSDSDEVIKGLYQLFDQMSPGVIYNTLRSLFTDLPVPLFYQDLALLVQAGYFNRIITTNFDTLLEQALDGAGLQAGFDYFVTSLGAKSESGDELSSDPEASVEAMQLTSHLREPVHIIKLHGDLAHGQINLSPGRLQQALRKHRRFVSSELKGDMVIVGYKFENAKVNDWLGSTANSRSRLWWVNHEDGHDRVVGWAPQVAFIAGDMARPEMFFSQLVLRLLRQPALATLGKSFKDYAKSFGIDVDFDVEEPAKEPESQGEEALTVLELRDVIKRLQTVLFTQEQAASSGDPPLNVQAQIRYQKRQIARFEDKLRAQPECRKRILELVDQINSAAANVPEINQQTLSYLEKQAYEVRFQYQTPAPNQQTISAAISVIVLLSERLRFEISDTAVPIDDVRELATYVPSLTGRGVIQ